MDATIWAFAWLAMLINRCINTVFAALLCISITSLCIAQADSTNQTSSNEATEKEQTAPQEAQSSESSNSNSEAKNADGDKRTSSDTFIPSEEISEDLSVAFPVDI